MPCGVSRRRRRSRKCDELLTGIRQGLYVRRLHYVNVDAGSAARGMTTDPDGTFLVENGRISRAVATCASRTACFEAFERRDGLTRAIASGNWWSDTGLVARGAVEAAAFHRRKPGPSATGRRGVRAVHSSLIT
jgi:hypothetical protein